VRRKEDAVSYYVDADVSGLAKILVQVRRDVTYPGDPAGPVKGGRYRPACPIQTPATPDCDWIPQSGSSQSTGTCGRLITFCMRSL
jgi:hypothetical protein